MRSTLHQLRIEIVYRWFSDFYRKQSVFQRTKSTSEKEEKATREQVPNANREEEKTRMFPFTSVDFLQRDFGSIVGVHNRASNLATEL